MRFAALVLALICSAAVAEDACARQSCAVRRTGEKVVEVTRTATRTATAPVRHRRACRHCR